MTTQAREFTDHYITVGRLKLHYLDWGNPDKPTMLCLHGGAQTAHSWDDFARPMREHYHIVALDQRGHGDSQWSANGIYGGRAQALDVERFTNALGMKKFTLMGLSMGGQNSFVFAAQHPQKVQRLIIVDIGPETMKRGRKSIQSFTSGDIQPTFEAFVERAHKFNPRRPIEQLRERLGWALKQLPDGRWTWKYDRTRRGSQAESLWPFVRRIKAPTLLIRGMDSDILAAVAARRLQKAIPGCTLVEVPNAGHTVNGDNPPEFNRVVREWLEKTPLKG